MEFKNGNFVYLISGGPRMTVNEAGRNIGCVWFDVNGSFHREYFSPEVLTDKRPVREVIDE